MELLPGQTVDPYEVEAMLKAGETATMYRVRHTRLDTVHALKVLSIPTRHRMEPLTREWNAHAHLNHPNIVAVTDVIEVEGALALVMEWVDGPSLRDFVRLQQLSLDQVDAIARDIIGAVAHAHRQGRFHMNLEPANVRLAIDRQAVVPKITDFGSAQLLTLVVGPETTASGLAKGAPAYRAPEQDRDTRSAGARHDVFSLGAILYELLTGSPAFDGPDGVAASQQACTRPFIDPSELVPDAPTRMVESIRRALDPDPTRRYDRCEALLDAWKGSAAAPGVSTAPSESWETDGPERATPLEAGSVGNHGMVAPADAGSAPPTAPPTLAADGRRRTEQDLRDPLSDHASGSATPAPQSPAPTGAPDDSGNAFRFAVLGIVLVLVVLPVFVLVGMFGAEILGAVDPDDSVETMRPTRSAGAPASLGVAPEPVGSPEAAAEPMPTLQTVPTPAASSATTARTAPGPDARSQPAAAASATIQHDGDGSLELQDLQGNRFPPGAVPPGSYVGMVLFPGDEQPRALVSLTVSAGSTITVRCVAASDECTVMH